MPDPSRDASSEQALRKAGLRVTRPRLAVMEALAAAPHSPAETVIGAVRLDETPRPISTQAVYDVLRALTATGLLRRIEPAGSPALFETRVGDNHHHLVCRGCSTVVDVDCVVGHAPCLEPSAAQGFSVDEAEVVFWGICGDCRSADAATTSPSDHPA